MAPATQSDLSLRHLPDLSDTSISFQIPATASDSTFLLTAKDDEFLRAAEGSLFFGEPSPLRDHMASDKPTRHSYRHIFAHEGSLRVPPSPGFAVRNEDTGGTACSTPNRLAGSMPLRDENLALERNFGGLKAMMKPPAELPETQTMATLTGVGPSITESYQSGVSQRPMLVRKKKSDTKPELTSAVVSKPRRTKSSSERSALVPAQSRSQETQHGARAVTSVFLVDPPDNPDCKVPSTRSPAARRPLPEFSDEPSPLSLPVTLSSAERPSEIDPPKGLDHDSSGDALEMDKQSGPCGARQNCHDRPLSQLSSRTVSPGPAPSPDLPRAPSPMRSAKKRSLPDSGASQNKKSRPLAAVRRLSNTMMGRGKPLSALGSQRVSRANPNTKTASTFPQARMPRKEGRIGTMAQASKVSPTSQATRKSAKAKENIEAGALGDMAHDSSSSHKPVGRGRQQQHPKNVQESEFGHANPTRSVASDSQSRSSGRQLHGRLDEEKDARERSSVVQKKKAVQRRDHSIPDFKAIHAMEETAWALRRHQIERTVPVPIEFATDIRAREREKFDEALRAKERERQAAQEERLRELAAAEEKEIRELRRKAVPRAHEVPEWYKDAPKRKGGSSIRG